MLINQVQIKHFRSLYQVELTLKPLTIIIGPNASGKSNLFKALRFVHTGVAGDRVEWQAYDSQIDDLLWYGMDESGARPDTMEFAFGFASSPGAPVARYAAKFHCGDYLQVREESLEVREDPQLRTYFERLKEQIRQYIGRRNKSLKTPYRSLARSGRTLTLRDEGADFSHPLAKGVYEHISGWRFFDVNLQLARQEAFVPPVPDAVPPLANDASNLSAFLYALWHIQPEDFDLLAETLADFVELPQKIISEHDAERGGKNARYSFIEQPFGENRVIPPHSMSDGTIRLLSHLALLLGDQTVTLACLEEPNIGLHPRLMLHLADVLRQSVNTADESTQKLQVIITTHNAEFMDCFNLEEEKAYLQVYVAERDEQGRTRFIPASADEFAPWLQKYRLGEAVRRRFL